MSVLSLFFDTQHDLSKNTIDAYKYSLKIFERFAEQSFDSVYLDEKVVHKVLREISEKYSASSWNLYLILYRRLAKWLNDPDDEITPKFWRKIKIKKIDWEKKLKDKWLSKDEFLRLLDVIDYARDKALFGVCVEGALRKGELLSLRLRDVTKTSYGYDLTVSGKTGSSSFPVVLFAPLLTHWLNMHPFKHNPEAPLWPRKKCVVQGDRFCGIQKGVVNFTLKRYAKQTGLSEKISLHWLRHTKITWTAKNKKVRISDEMAKKMFRWGASSRMFGRYTHLHGVDSKDTFLALAGVKEIEEKETVSVLDPKKCLNCGEMNSATMMFCGKCGTTLDEQEALRQVAKQNLMDEMLKDFKERMSHQENLRKLKKESKDKSFVDEQEKLVKAVNKLKDYKTKLQIKELEEKKKK